MQSQIPVTESRPERHVGAQARLDLTGNARRAVGEKFMQVILLVCGLISIVTTVGIVAVLIEETLQFFSEVSISEFLTNPRWQPKNGNFGVLSLLAGTLLTTLMAMLVALPVGLAAAVYLSEYASPRIRTTFKPILEILAGVPTVVYGYFALMTVTPLLRSMFGTDNVSIFNAASAGLVMGIMIIPMISSLSEDAMSAVPRALREGAYGLGATKFEVATKVVIPAALSGIMASFILGISRAVGETMIVALAAGATPKLTLNPFESIQTLTGYIVQVSGGDTAYGTLDYTSIYAVGMTLFLMTLFLNIFSNIIVSRFREVYD
jgi:phosphate transport system permease protein